MALLERITSMQQSGMPDVQIINTLRDEGISPLEINEAISQSKIKAAIAPEQASISEGGELQPSIMAAGEGPAFLASPDASPTTTQYSEMPAAQANAPVPAYAPEQYPQAPAYPPAQEAYPQAQYDQQAYAPEQAPGYYPGVLDIETVRDISKQITDEAFRKIREEISSLSKMKTELRFELQDTENRLKQVESVIQELQSAVIRKMGEYGESIKGISKEIQATQQSFAKVINPLMDKKRGISREAGVSEEKMNEQPIQETEKKQEPKDSASSKKERAGKPSPKNPSGSAGSTASFEDYFR